MKMNTRFIIALLTLLGMPHLAAAQESEYVPFVREGVKWVYYIDNYSVIYPANPYYPEGRTYFTLELKGDTVIGGKQYKAMHKYYGNSINWANDTVPVYLREEDRVVYAIVPDGREYFDCPLGNKYFSHVDPYNGEEYVLYDFNDPESFWNSVMNDYEDDVYEPFSTDTITVGQHRVKRHIGYVLGNDEFNKFYSIESIGLDSWRPGTPLCFFMIGFGPSSVYFKFSHVIEDGEIIYKTEWYHEPDPEPSDYEYVPFVREGVKWVYAINDYQWRDYNNNPANGDFIAHRTLELRGDTVINGKLYKAMHKCVDDEISEPSDVVPIYLREEDKKVYGIVPDGVSYDDAPIGDFFFGTREYFNAILSGEEFLLYDFQNPVAYWDSISLNSSWNPELLEFFHLYVDTIAVGDHLVKSYHNSSDDFKIIEGIGLICDSSYPLGFFLPVSTGVHGEYYWLETVIEDGKVIYGSNRDKYMPLIREGVKWVNKRVIVNNGDTTCNYYTYEFKGNHPKKGDYNLTYKALYRYDGWQHELDVECDSLVAGLREDWRDVQYFCNEPLNLMISQGRDLIEFDQGFLYQLITSRDGWGTCKDNYIKYQKEQFLNNDNFFEVDPITIDGYRCSRLAYLNEQGDTVAYIVEGIGFDSRDMGDLLTPFTRKPDPNADYQEWCGLSHVIKDGKIIYKGMCYDPDVEPVIPGDANGDGEISIADANSVIDIVIMGGNASHPRMPAVDINDDGEVTIADVNVIIDIILKNNSIY